MNCAVKVNQGTFKVLSTPGTSKVSALKGTHESSVVANVEKTPENSSRAKKLVTPSSGAKYATVTHKDGKLSQITPTGYKNLKQPLGTTNSKYFQLK